MGGGTFKLAAPPHLCRVKPLRCSDRETASVTLQNLLLALHHFWADQGCVIHIPYDLEVGAGTFHPATFLKVLGPDPWRTASVQHCRRPTDRRSGANHNRLLH